MTSTFVYDMGENAVHHHHHHHHHHHQQQPQQPAPGELRRSFAKLDIAAMVGHQPPQQRGTNNNNNYVRQQSHHHHHQERRRNTVSATKIKPTMEIYRPPNVRTDGIQNGLRLNVHAKEFKMETGDLRASKSSANVPAMLETPHIPQIGLQHSKSSGSGLHTLHHASSSGNILQSPRVHFQPIEDINRVEMIPPQLRASYVPNLRPAVKSYSTAEMKTVITPDVNNSKIQAVLHMNPNPETHLTKNVSFPSSLKRSKSLGAADMVKAASAGNVQLKDFPELGDIPVELEKAVVDPNKVSARALMDLVRFVLERAVGTVFCALPAAKLCIHIIEKEHNETFLESLVNMCQKWYQERDRILKVTGGVTGFSPNHRFCAFIQFLNEMYCVLKRRQLQLKTKHDGVPPGLVLLNLIFNSCLDCLKPPYSLGEVDTLFFVLTTVGKDLGQELPTKMPLLMASIRDAYLMEGVAPRIKKTLLQLIELHASRWQLPASAMWNKFIHLSEESE